MSGYRPANSGPAYLDEYEPVDDRIKAFRADYPGASGRIETFPTLNDGIVFEARISVRDDEGEYITIANGHAFDKWGAASQLERTEKAAIGRALVMAGYSAKRGPSAEEMDKHADQQTGGAAVPRGNSPATPHNAPRATERAKQAPVDDPPQTSARNAVSATPWEKLDRAKLKPSYVAIIEKARGMVEQGEGEDKIKKFLASKKRAMSDREYTDALYRFGEIQTLIADRDVVESVRDEVTGTAETDGKGNALDNMTPEQADRMAASMASVGDGKGNHPGKYGDDDLDDLDF